MYWSKVGVFDTSWERSSQAAESVLRGSRVAECCACVCVVWMEGTRRQVQILEKERGIWVQEFLLFLVYKNSVQYTTEQYIYILNPITLYLFLFFNFALFWYAFKFMGENHTSHWIIRVIYFWLLNNFLVTKHTFNFNIKKKIVHTSENSMYFC